MSKFSSTLQKQLATIAGTDQLVSSSFSAQDRTATVIRYCQEGAQLSRDIRVQSLDISIDSSGRLFVQLVLGSYPLDGQTTKISIHENMLTSFDGKSLRELGMEFIKKEIIARRSQKSPSKKRKDS